MSAKLEFDREIVEFVRHGRPTFFADPAMDKLLAISMALLGEVCTLRDRLDVHERLAAENCAPTAPAIDAYAPDAEAERARSASREAAIARVLSVLTEDVVRLKHER